MSKNSGPKVRQFHSSWRAMKKVKRNRRKGCGMSSQNLHSKVDPKVDPKIDLHPEVRTVASTQSEKTEIVLPNDTNMLGNLLGGRLMHFIDLTGAMAAYRHARTHV